MKESLKKKLFLSLRLLISFSLIGYIFYRLAAEHQLSDLLRYWTDLRYGWLTGAFLITLAILAVGSMRWGMLLAARGVKLSRFSYFMYYMVGMFFNNFLPSTVGGDVVKAYYLSRATGKTAIAFISVLLDRLMGIGGLCVVAIVSCLVGGSTLLAFPGTRPYALPVFLIVGGLSLSLGLFFLVSFNERVMNFFLSLSRWGKIGEKIRELHQALYLYKGQSGVLVKTLLISTGIWMLIVIASWMISRAFTGKIPPISLVYFFLFMPTISVIMSLPISFAGLGTREMAFMIFFGALPGVSELDALVISLTFYLLYIAASLIGGVIYVFKDTLRFHREVPALDLTGLPSAPTIEEESAR